MHDRPLLYSPGHSSPGCSCSQERSTVCYEIHAGACDVRNEWDRLTSAPAKGKRGAMNSVLRVITAYDYECIIAVDIPTGYFKTHTGGSHCILLPEQGDLEEQVRSAADCFVLPEDRQEYLEKMSLPAINAPASPIGGGSPPVKSSGSRFPSSTLPRTRSRSS